MTASFSSGNMPQMNDIKELLVKYRAELLEAVNATNTAINQLKQQLNTMERQQIAIAAQKALLDTIEKDIQLKDTNADQPTA